jgi:hypothetical protein
MTSEREEDLAQAGLTEREFLEFNAAVIKLAEDMRHQGRIGDGYGRHAGLVICRDLSSVSHGSASRLA